MSVATPWPKRTRPHDLKVVAFLDVFHVLRCHLFDFFTFFLLKLKNGWGLSCSTKCPLIENLYHPSNCLPSLKTAVYQFLKVPPPRLIFGCLRP